MILFIDPQDFGHFTCDIFEPWRIPFWIGEFIRTKLAQDDKRRAPTWRMDPQLVSG